MNKESWYDRLRNANPADQLENEKEDMEAAFLAIIEDIVTHQIERPHVAYHEAGHVITAVDFGWKFGPIRIYRNENGALAGAVEWVKDPEQDDGTSKQEARTKSIAQILAGCVAEALVLGKPDTWWELLRLESHKHGAVCDFTPDYDVITKLLGHEPSKEDLLHATSLLGDIFKRRWHELAAVAESLIARHNRANCVKVVVSSGEVQNSIRGASSPLRHKGRRTPFPRP